MIFDLTDNRIIEKKPYWELRVNDLEGDKGPTEDDYDVIKSYISSSVKSQMIADVPVGGFLSGGIDSSILSVEALKINPLFQTFSIGFYDFEANELPYVECLEKAIGFKSKKYLVKKNEFHHLYLEMKKWFDEPFSDTSGYPTYIVSNLTKTECTVALSGDGGDEVFGGYTRYARYLDLLEKENPDKKKEFEFFWNSYLFDTKVNRQELRIQLNIPDDYDDYWFYRKYYREDLPPITRMQYMDFHTYLPCDVLTKTDRVSMAVSLETRVPLLSKEIIEYSFSLTQSQRCPDKELKGLIKQAYTGAIPHNLLYRRKWGFGIPSNFFGYGKIPQKCLEEDVFQYGACQV